MCSRPLRQWMKPMGVERSCALSPCLLLHFLFCTTWRMVNLAEQKQTWKKSSNLYFFRNFHLQRCTKSYKWLSWTQRYHNGTTPSQQVIRNLRSFAPRLTQLQIILAWQDARTPKSPCLDPWSNRVLSGARFANRRGRVLYDHDSFASVSQFFPV